MSTATTLIEVRENLLDALQVDLRREGIVKQPENFGAILRRYPRITQNAGTGPGYFLRIKRKDARAQRKPF